MRNREISKDSGYPHFITTVTQNRKKVLLDDPIPKMLIDNLAFYKKQHQFMLIGFVLMPDHVHLIIHPNGKTPVNMIMHDYKSYTAQIINKWFHRTGPFWQPEFNDRLIRGRDELKRELDYIHNNPIVAGLVKTREDYSYSSWKYYTGKSDSDLVDIGW
jgi:putative transposase